jgi:branched-chain amino acid transport system substrate-binding protein
MAALRGVLYLLMTLITVPVFAQKATSTAPILVGQSAGLTGGQAGYSADVKTGIESYFNAVNKSGGVNGRPLKLISEDDQGKKDKVLVNTKKLVETDRVIALIGYTSGAGVEATLDYLERITVPMLSPMTGNMGIRAAFHKSLFHTRAGYDDEMKKIIGSLALALKRFAVVYLDDVGPGNPKSIHEALAANNLKAVVDVPVNRNAADFSPQVEALVKSNPEVVVFISNGPPIVKIIQGMRAKGYGGQFATSSFSGLKVIEELKGMGSGLIMSQVLPQPARTHLKVVKDYQQHLQEFAPTAKPNYTSLEGYVAARVLVEGLHRAGNNPGPEKLVAALESIRSLDLGGYEINFSGKNHDGSHFVNTGVVGSDSVLRY